MRPLAHRCFLMCLSSPRIRPERASCSGRPRVFTITATRSWTLTALRLPSPISRIPTNKTRSLRRRLHNMAPAARHSAGAGFEDLRKHVRNFEDRSILDGRSVPPVAGYMVRLDHFSDGGGDLIETAQYDPGLLLPHPFRVIPFLRQSPCIRFHDDGQAHSHSFAQAAWTGLADEEVREAHIIGNLLREPFDEPGNLRRRLPERVRQRFIAAADHNKLGLHLGAAEAFGDIHHHGGAVAAEQHEACRKLGLKTETAPLRDGIDLNRLIEARMQDHSGGAEDPTGRVAHRARMFGGPIRAADEKLLLLLDPEMGR